MGNRSRVGTLITALVSTSALLLGQLPTVLGQTSNNSRKQIQIDGLTYNEPYAIVSNQTTYMPIWYLMNILPELGVTSHWANGTWNLSYTAHTAVDTKVFTTGHSGDWIQLNGDDVARVPVIEAVDKASQSSQLTTYMPIWYVMQALNRLGITSTWNGTSWNLQTTKSLVVIPGSQPVTSPIASIAHIAPDDTLFYQRASEGMYVSAQTGNPLDGQTSTASMDDVQPGQSIYLFTWANSKTMSPTGVTWIVNRSDANIVPDTTHRWTLSAPDGSSVNAAAATFTASAPGVYTIQAESSEGVYSVPLVILVGLQSLTTSALTMTSASGIRPFFPTAIQPLAVKQDGSGTTFDVYPASIDGYIPISGKTKAGVTQVQVTFGSNPGTPTWSYAIPVNADGFFQADVRAPESGTLLMQLFTTYTADLTRWQHGEQPIDQPQTVTIPVNTPGPTSSQRDLFASAKMDYNLLPTVDGLALTLYQEAGSMESAIQAINNYVAAKIVYDQLEDQPAYYQFQDGVETLARGEGVCEDYAELEADMLRSIGIPTETVQGVGNSSFGQTQPTTVLGDNHEWLRVFDGTSWILSDPTWTTADTSVNGWISNEFFTETTSFDATHQPDPNAIGTPAASNPFTWTSQSLHARNHSRQSKSVVALG